MHLWVMGKREPGWYMAKWAWDGAWAEHLRGLGYEVRQSEEKPV